MFIHSGAGLHGHEYSSPCAAAPQPNYQDRKSPFLRAAFVGPKSLVVTHETVDDQRPKPRTALRRRPVSDYVPRAPEPVVRFMEPDTEPESDIESSSQERMVKSSSLGHNSSKMSNTGEDKVSESDLSDLTPATETTNHVSSRRRKRQATRKGTTFFLGYPTPKLLGKKKVVQRVLPRLMLQLKKVLDDGHSHPVMEVFPATRISGPVIAHHMAKRFPGIFGVKHQLCYDDLVLVRRDDHIPTKTEASEESENEDGHPLEERKLLAVYSPLKNSSAAEIVLDDGSIWVATPLRNGSFDFVHMDANGNSTTVRWAKRSPATPSINKQSTSSTLEPRFTFSVINPLTRRHPVMATLTKSSLQIQDTFVSVSSSHARYPPSRPLGRTMSTYEGATPSAHNRPASSDTEADSGVSVMPEPPLERKVVEIDEGTKLLIGVTALWVALSLGWSANYTPHINTAGECSAPGTPPSSVKGSRRNTWTRNNVSADSEMTAFASTTTILSKRVSAPPEHGRRPCLERARSVSPAASPLCAPSPAPTHASVPLRTAPRRATSTGAAFMQRMIEKKGGRDSPSQLTSPDAAAGGGCYFPDISSTQLATQGVPHRRNHSVSFASKVSVAGQPGEVIQQDTDEEEDAVSVEELGTSGTGSPPIIVTAMDPFVEDTTIMATKKGVKAKFARFFHKLGRR